MLLLVAPRFPASLRVGSFAICEPLGLLRLAAAAELAGVQCTVADLRLGGSLLHAVRRHKPRVVGFTALTFDVPRVFAAARTLRREHPDLIIVVGGEHATTSPACFLGYNSPFDYVFRGLSGGFPASVPSLSQQSTPSVIDDPSPAPILPRRVSLSRRRPRYLYGAATPLSLATFSEGCRFRCSFCSIPNRSPKTNYHTVDQCVAQLREAPTREILLTDANALDDAEKAHEIYSEVSNMAEPRRLMISTRTDNFVQAPDGLIDALVSAGVAVVAFGVEAPSGDTLRAYRKGTLHGNSESAIRRAHEAGLLVRANFILDPARPEAQFEEASDFIIRNDIEFPTFQVLTPLPGTKVFAHYRMGRDSIPYERFDLAHLLVVPSHVTPTRFMSRYDELIYRSYGPRRLAWLASRIGPYDWARGVLVSAYAMLRDLRPRVSRKAFE